MVTLAKCSLVPNNDRRLADTLTKGNRFVRTRDAGLVGDSEMSRIRFDHEYAASRAESQKLNLHKLSCG
jgi:hypothetical protein